MAVTYSTLTGAGQNVSPGNYNEWTHTMLADGALFIAARCPAGTVSSCTVDGVAQTAIATENEHKLYCVEGLAAGGRVIRVTFSDTNLYTVCIAWAVYGHATPPYLGLVKATLAANTQSQSVNNAVVGDIICSVCTWHSETYTVDSPFVVQGVAGAVLEPRIGSAIAPGAPGTQTATWNINAATSAFLFTVPQSTGVSPPGAPTIGTAVAGDGTVSVAFTPGTTGGAPILEYRVRRFADSAVTGSFTASPAAPVVSANGVATTFAVAARNSAGWGAYSAESNSVTPAAGASSGPLSRSSILGTGESIFRSSTNGCGK